MRGQEIVDAMNGFLKTVKAIDPKFVMGKRNGNTFTIEKTSEGVTEEIYFEMFDRGNWRNSEESCRGFTIWTNLYRSRDRRIGTKRIMDNNLERFSDIVKTLIDDVNNEIQNVLLENISNCNCTKRYTRKDDSKDFNEQKLLKYLQIPKLESPYMNDGIRLYISLNRNDLNLKESEIRLDHLSVAEMREVSNLVIMGSNKFKHIVISKYDETKFTVKLEDVNQLTMKLIIDTLRNRIDFKEESN